MRGVVKVRNKCGMSHCGMKRERSSVSNIHLLGMEDLNMSFCYACRAAVAAPAAFRVGDLLRVPFELG